MRASLPAATVQLGLQPQGTMHPDACSHSTDPGYKDAFDFQSKLYHKRLEGGYGKASRIGSQSAVGLDPVSAGSREVVVGSRQACSIAPPGMQIVIGLGGNAGDYA